MSTLGQSSKPEPTMSQNRLSGNVRMRPNKNYKVLRAIYSETPLTSRPNGYLLPWFLHGPKGYMDKTVQKNEIKQILRDGDDDNEDDNSNDNKHVMLLFSFLLPHGLFLA